MGLVKYYDYSHHLFIFLSYIKCFCGDSSCYFLCVIHVAATRVRKLCNCFHSLFLKQEAPVNYIYLKLLASNDVNWNNKEVYYFWLQQGGCYHKKHCWRGRASGLEDPRQYTFLYLVRTIKQKLSSQFGNHCLRNNTANLLCETQCYSDTMERPAFWRVPKNLHQYQVDSHVSWPIAW